jgi:hypothetical protein
LFRMWSRDQNAEKKTGRWEQHKGVQQMRIDH